MRRRKLLVGLAGSVAGCLGGSDGALPETTSETTSPTSTPRPVPEDATELDRTSKGSSSKSRLPRKISVQTVQDEPLRETFGVAVEVSVTEAEVTAGDTAQVELALRTTGDSSRSVEYEQQHCGRNEFRARTGDFELFLFPAGGSWTVPDTDCPVVSYPNVNCGIPAVDEPITVPASGALRWRYDVLVPAENLDGGGCVVPGSYRFTREFSGEESSVRLSFTLSVTET